MKRLLYFLLVVLVGAILVETAFLYSRFSSSSFRIVSQKDGDVAGRTVVYKLSNTVATDVKNYAVGIFQGWEEVKGSKDRYLLLQDVGSVKQAKYRVVFTPGRFSSWRVATRLGVEDLGKTKSGADLEAIDGVGRVGDLAERLDDLMIKGDIVAVRQTMPDGRAILDENMIAITPWIAVRRWQGKKAIEL